MTALPSVERLVEIQCAIEDGPDDDGFSADMARTIDAVLAAPVVALTPGQRATWGACPVCGAQPDVNCRWVTRGDVAKSGHVYVHPARLDAAPTHVRLVPCDGEGTPSEPGR